MIDERFPNWLVDVEKGTIYSLKHKRYIGSINKDGYVYVNPPKGYKHAGFHQYIWMVANQADIPEGYDVHHIDGNRQNNSIYNLELVEQFKHRSEHKKGINHYLYGKHHTDESKKKISESKKGKHHTEEHRRKISEAHKGINNPFYGKHHTEETKNKISETLKGFKHSDETKRKISKANVNNPKLSKKVAQYTLKGELVKVWCSINECGRNGFNLGNICECCNGKRKKHKGYIWKYINE